MPNLVKYCVDCFSLLFSVLVRVGYISGCISLRLVGGFLREIVVLRTTFNIKGGGGGRRIAFLVAQDYVPILVFLASLL